MRTFPSTLTAALIAMLVAATLGAQTRDDRADGDRAEQREAAQRRRGIAESVLLWVEDYERDRLVPRGVLNAEPSLQPRYARVARAHDLLSLRDGGALMHVDALQKLLYFAERDPDETIAAAVLSVATKVALGACRESQPRHWARAISLDRTRVTVSREPKPTRHCSTANVT